MLLAQFTLTWKCICRDNDEKPKNSVESTHEAWETNERCIAIIGDGLTGEIINMIRKRREIARKRKVLQLECKIYYLNFTIGSSHKEHGSGWTK